MKTLGRKLAAARKSQHLTQKQLAKQVNVARPTISNWENDRSQPDYEALRVLSKILQCDFLAQSSHLSGEQEPRGRKLRLKLSDSPVIEVISAENACVFSDVTVNLQVNGSDSHGNPVQFRIFANCCVENDTD